MSTISLCMIVKNEEETLPRCLDSVGDVADEIIIVDTGSTDRTKEKAAAYTSRIFDFKWINDFSAARNYAFDQAAMDYQMWLDADDVLPDEEREKLRRLKETLAPGVDMVTMKYQTHFDEKGAPLLVATRERLVRRERHYRWRDPVHEYIPLVGNILHSDIVIAHRKPPSEGVSTRNLEIYQSIEYGGRLSPRQEYYFARELADHGQHAKALYYFTRFLDGGRGWTEASISACYCMARGEYRPALEWFRFGAGLDLPDSIGFFLNRYWHYVPNIEAGGCCYRLGRLEQALEFNERAARGRPGDPAAATNRALYRRILEERKP